MQIKRDIDCLIATGTANLAGPQYLTTSIILTLAKNLVAWGRKTAILVIDPSVDPALVARDESEGITIFRTAEPVSTLPALSFGLGRPRILLLPNHLADYNLLQTPGLDITIWLGEDDLAPLAARWVTAPVRLWAESQHVADHAARLLQRAVPYLPPPVAPPRGLNHAESDRNAVAVVGARPCDGIALTLALARERQDLRFIVIDWPRLDEAERQQFFALAAAAGNIDWRRPDNPGALLTALAGARVLMIPAMVPIGHRDWIHQMRQAGWPLLGSDLGAIPALIGDQGQVLPPGAPPALWLQQIDRLRRATVIANPGPSSSFDVITTHLLADKLAG